MDLHLFFVRFRRVFVCWTVYGKFDNRRCLLRRLYGLLIGNLPKMCRKNKKAEWRFDLLF